MLGPEKLPRVVSEFGRWVGRARVMARQFREQLEEEVQLEQARKAQAASAQTAAGVRPRRRHTPRTRPPSREARAPKPPPALTTRRAEPVSAHPSDATGADPTAPRAVSTTERP